MRYRVILCGGLLATAVLLSFPHSSSALPAAPSALLPAAAARGSAAAAAVAAVAAAATHEWVVAAVRPTRGSAVAT